MITGFTPRLYQETILSTAVSNNTLVVLPTGLGKTNIFVMLASYRLMKHPNSKVLFLGPTRPLIEQYKNVIIKNTSIPEEEVALFTGQVSPKKRQELWKNARVIVSTPQGFENDIISGRITLEDVSLIAFDEAHKAVGDYAYVWIAKRYHETAKHERILGLTASPGTDAEKITEVCDNLLVDKIESRKETDYDVKDYVQEMETEWVKVDLPESFKRIQKFLNECYNSKLAEIVRLGYLNKDKLKGMSKKEILSMQGTFQYEISTGNKDFDLLRSISLLSEAIKTSHAQELLETQGISALFIYMDKIFSDASSSKIKAVKNLAADPNFKSAYMLVLNMSEAGVEHPKLARLKSIVSDEIGKNPKAKIIVFNQFRDSIAKLTDEMNDLAGVNAVMFVGQAKKNGTGLSQKQQAGIIEDFKDHKYNVVCMSSVGEEGLDIPQVDLVIFYEPVPSAIRTIQRRGRTGRQGKGRVIILCATGTRDEAYRWSAHHKEKRMYRCLDQVKKNLSLTKKKAVNKSLSNYGSDQIKIYVDHREKGSHMLKKIIEMGIRIELKQLKIADYVLSDRVGVEYKTVDDFVDSLVDGRLMTQVRELKSNYERPIIMIQGEKSIYSVRNIHPNAIRGLLSVIMVSYGIPIIFTETNSDSAEMIAIVARREQEEVKRNFTPHGDKKSQSMKDQQEYIISSLPLVGTGLAKPLLKKFGSVKAIVNATVDELKEVEKIGDKKAKQIFDVINEKWKEN
ncbi:DEAD/DEAH box helicase [Candidatus Woesearchaeota archaeon]|nr:DEAD/DEAH box helicase [Candidatus Woesearchaeota archaeon]